MREKPASVAHDLIVINPEEPLADRVLTTLQRKGFAFRAVKNFDDAGSLVSTLVQPIILLYGGEKKSAGDFAKKMLEYAELFPYPALVVGKEVDGLEAELTQYFGFATTIRAPFNPNDLLQALRYIAREYKVQTAEEKKREVPPPIEEAPRQEVTSISVLEEDEEMLLPQQAHALYSQSQSVPSLLFQQLQNYKLFERSIGGAIYPTLTKEAKFDLRKMVPPDKLLGDSFKHMCEELGRWSQVHLYRCSFLTEKLLGPLNFDTPFCSQAHLACLFFPFAFGRKNRSLLRKEYTGRGTLLLRKELCSLMKDSALKVATGLRLPEVADLIAMVGKLVGREEVVNDECGVVLASAVMAADLTDRVCFQAGTWNPRAAYVLVRKIKAGRLRDLHPAILCTLVKLLSEAVTEAPPAHLLSRAIRENPELLAKAKEIRDQEVTPQEAKISLTSLTPGMRLSRPLYAFDGREILSEDLILDEDLILRIWQLSALRPLIAPVVVRGKDEPKE